MPASRANAAFGLMPTAMTTSVAGMMVPSASSTCSTLPLPVIVFVLANEAIPIAVLGLAVNLVSAWLLSGGHHGDVTVIHTATNILTITARMFVGSTWESA